LRSRILLVEDEPGLVLTISDLLQSEAYDVVSAADGEAGFAQALTDVFDLIILDVMLPRKNGFEVCRELRQQGHEGAVLMLTARSQVMHRIAGLKLGADDYLTKPFDAGEFLARVEALLRRTNRGEVASVRAFSFNDVHIDFEQGEVKKAGQPVALAGKELQLLRYLIDQRGQVVSREELLQNVWEYQSDVSSRTIDVHIAWMRQKLEDQPQNPRHIRTVGGKGYRFAT
jgi:two-component system, OmpR family, alkaline phosphatase synthesis response regulator PhoP